MNMWVEENIKVLKHTQEPGIVECAFNVRRQEANGFLRVYR